MIRSVYRPVDFISLPAHTGLGLLYQHEMILSDGVALPESHGGYLPVVRKLLSHVPEKSRVAYVTIHEKVLLPGETHRRAGAHIDGVWLTSRRYIPGISKVPPPKPKPPRGSRKMPQKEEKEKLDIDDSTGSHNFRPARSIGHSTSHSMGSRDQGCVMLISDAPGCRVYSGDFLSDYIGAGGDCEHLRPDLNRSPSEIMQPNVAYLMGFFGVHESIPVAQGGPRNLVRINLPDASWR